MDRRFESVPFDDIRNLFVPRTIDQALFSDSLSSGAECFALRGSRAAALLVNADTGFTIVAGDSSGAPFLLEYAVNRIRAGQPKKMPFISLPGPEWGAPADRCIRNSTERFSVATFFHDPVFWRGNKETLCPIPEGWDIFEIDGQRAATIANEDKIFGRAWTAHRDHGDAVYALCAMRDHVVGSYVYAGFPSSTLVDVTTFTHPDHRRKGLAGAVCERFIRDALRRRIEVHWGTTADNTASIQLALALDLKPEPLHDWLYVKPERCAGRHD